MSFNDVEFLGGFITDGVSDSLGEPDSAIPVLEAAAVPLTEVALLTGPRPLYITNIQVLFQDVAVDDPGQDVYLGWAVYSASDGSTTATFTSLAGYTANGDLPLINDQNVSTTAIQAVVNVPVDLFNYVGRARETADVMYATQAAMPAGSKVAPIRVAANSLYHVRLGCYLAGGLVAVTGMADTVIMVYGRRV